MNDMDSFHVKERTRKNALDSAKTGGIEEGNSRRQGMLI